VVVVVLIVVLVLSYFPRTYHAKASPLSLIDDADDDDDDDKDYSGDEMSTKSRNPTQSQSKN